MRKGSSSSLRGERRDSDQREAKQPKSGKHAPKTRSHRVTSVLWGLFTSALVLFLAISWKQYQRSLDKGSQSKVRGHSSDDLHLNRVPPSQRHSLFKPYALDYQKVSKVREKSMRKYEYSYDKNGVDKRNDLSLEEFYDVYDGKWPVVITDVIPTWPASNWSQEFFANNYGEDRVTMKAVDLQLDLAFSHMFTTPLLHLNNELSLQLTNHLLFNQPSPQSTLANAVSLALPLGLFYKNTHQADPHRWTYVEDELFLPMRPQLTKDIGENIYLDEDFYQLFPEEVRPWNAMLLWGTKYSRSSLHMDPYNWTGTNAVIVGRKRWKLYPPGQDHLLYIKENRKSGFPLNCFKYNSPIDTIEPDLKQYPLYEKAEAIEFDQYPGELLIIPTGWYHQAYNVEETIAVSSQVMNRNNFRIVLEEILKVDNVQRRSLPTNIDSLSPEDQIKTVMSLLPPSVLARGKQVTEDALLQIKYGYEKTRSMMSEPPE